MTDHLTKKQRSSNMRKIKSKNTIPELIVRKFLFNSGIRYRIHNNSLPGKPDISNKRKKFVVFVNGCFWHRHKNCKFATIPKSNVEYWEEKFIRNIHNLETNKNQLLSIGYKVFEIWECEIKQKGKLNKLTRDIRLHENTTKIR